jgi:hypothetical protein
LCKAGYSHPPGPTASSVPTASPSPTSTSASLYHGSDGYIEILVDVNANGTVNGARIIHSNGNLSDYRFLHDAKMAHYSAKMVNCKPVEGVYHYFYYYPAI